MMGKGNSFANGPSAYNGPLAQYRKNGWDYRPVTLWDLVEGRDPA